MKLWKLLRRGHWYICWTLDEKVFTALDVENFETETASSFREAFSKIAGESEDEAPEADPPAKEKPKKPSKK